MRVLIGCERSGIVRDAFRRLGHEAWSCDLEGVEPGGAYPQFHLFGDVRQFLRGINAPWDLAIFFPDCTFLTNSAEWAYGDGPYHMKLKPDTLVGAARREARIEAVTFVKQLRASPIPRIAVENPRGHLSRAIGRPTQTIQPNQFGADASKATCLWLQGLMPLRPTCQIPGRIVLDPRTGKMVERWANQTDSGQNRLTPSADRAMERAGTYPGVGEAMALQWGGKAA